MPHAARSTRTPRRPAAGFTLMELLVVVAILAILMLSTMPMIYAMIRLTSGGAGANTVNVAVTAARAYAVRDMGGSFSSVPQAKYSGSAILFTPSNQLFLIENIAGAGDGGTLLEPARNGYGYISGRDPIKLQNSVTAYGILRYDSTGAGQPAVKLVSAPFAIRFDQNGNLVPGEDASASGGEDSFVYLNSNSDNDYDTSSTRPAGYSPDDWNPKIVSMTPSSLTGAYEVGFECIESVMGVVVVPTSAFRSQVQNYSSALGGTKLPGSITVDDSMADFTGDVDTVAKAHYRLKQWMLENGQLLFFSRTTGNLFRESRTR